MLTSPETDTLRERLARLFCGNRETLDALAEMIAARRMPHAFIVEGADGLGKSAFARLIARGAMCTCASPLSEKCPHCRKMRDGVHPDFSVLTGSGKTNAISIDAVREMRAAARIAPNEADKRVFVLEDCDNMQPAAQNAFLKIFEEAPPHVIFIVTCRSAAQLLTTIRSRGRIITLYPPSPAEGAAFLCRQRPDLSPQEAEAVCEACDGNLGLAMRRLGGDGSDSDSAKADALAAGILEAMGGSELTLAVRCAAIGRDRLLADAVCRQLKDALRQALMVSVGAADTLTVPSPEVLRLGGIMSPEALTACMEEINTLSDWLRINISMPLFHTRLAIVLQRR